MYNKNGKHSQYSLGFNSDPLVLYNMSDFLSNSFCLSGQVETQTAIRAVRASEALHQKEIALS